MRLIMRHRVAKSLIFGLRLPRGEDGAFDPRVGCPSSRRKGTFLRFGEPWTTFGPSGSSVALKIASSATFPDSESYSCLCEHRPAEAAPPVRPLHGWVAMLRA